MSCSCVFLKSSLRAETACSACRGVYFSELLSSSKTGDCFMVLLSCSRTSKAKVVFVDRTDQQSHIDLKEIYKNMYLLKNCGQKCNY